MRNKPQILVIDDEKDIRVLFKDILTSEGYIVLTALEGKSGLKIVEEKKPDIVLLDLKMPKMNGIEILRRIKRIDKNIVIIIITGYGTMDTARMSMKLGAYDYITKPFDLNHVKAVIKDGLKSTLQSFVDQMKERKILKDIRSRQTMLARVKRCKESHACLWEIAIRTFVLGDDSIMGEWMENPEVGKEEKLGLIQIAQILKENMAEKVKT